MWPMALRIHVEATVRRITALTDRTRNPQLTRLRLVVASHSVADESLSNGPTRDYTEEGHNWE